MRRVIGKHIAAATIAVLGVGCAVDQPAPPTALEFSVPIFAAGGNTGSNLGTHLTGDQEVPRRETRAQGQAIFRVSDDGKHVSYRLIASNIYNVNQAHIHCGLKGANGPVIVWLFPSNGPPAAPSGGGRHDGVLATGTFALGSMKCLAADIGRNEDVALIDAMRAGLTYVNVHTNDGVPPINTGPGDFPMGEIRGQIDHGSSHGNR